MDAVEYFDIILNYNRKNNKIRATYKQKNSRVESCVLYK